MRRAGSAVGGLVALALTVGVVGGGWPSLGDHGRAPRPVATRGTAATTTVPVAAGDAAPAWSRWPAGIATTTTATSVPPTTPPAGSPPSTAAPAARAPRHRPSAPSPAPPPPAPTTTAPAPPPPPPVDVGNPSQQAMLALVNAQRTTGRSCGGTWHGPVPALSLSGALSSAATAHAVDMATRDFFDHTGSDGSDAGRRIQRAGYAWSAWGENIAAGQPTDAVVIGSWFDSPGHCANFMSPLFRQVGFGRADGGAYGTYWAAALAAPA